MRLFNIMDTSFENFDKTINDFLSKSFSNLGMKYGRTQLFNVIFQGIKGVVQNAMFYIEDAFTEQNIFTARRKKSIYSLAKLSGYEPFYGTAAVGTVLGKVVISNGFDLPSTKIYIKNHQTLKCKTTGLTYSIILPTDYYIFDIAKPLVAHEFKVVQGIWHSASYVASGANFETISINFMSLFDKDYIEVYVNNEKYSQTACTYDMTEDSKEYVVSVAYDGTFQVMFGNGMYGHKLEEGDTITIKYVSHQGTLGNLNTDDGPTFEFSQPCVDGFGNTIDANEYIILDINNMFSGGTDADSIRKVRKLAGYSSRNFVYATEDNFKLFLNRFSFIGQTSIWSEPNSLAVTVCALNNKKDDLTSPEQYLELEDEDLLLSEHQKKMVSETLSNSNKVFGGIQLIWKDPIIRKYAGICYVKANTNYDHDTIKTQIKNAIANYFMNLPENTQFIPKSDIVQTVLDNVKNIDSFDISILSQADEDSFYKGYYYKYELKFINGTYQYVPVKYIYENDRHAGLDDYGNIKLDSKLEIPLFHGNFKYYPNKAEMDKSTSLTIDTLQIIFI